MKKYYINNQVVTKNEFYERLEESCYAYIKDVDEAGQLFTDSLEDLDYRGYCIVDDIKFKIFID